MRIVIVGAGAVGTYLAERLSLEGQDVVIIESTQARVAELQSKLDVMVVYGNGSSPITLAEAQVEKAELLIAVSDNDGANVLACHLAHEMGVPRTVARVEDPGLRDGLSKLGVDVVIEPRENAAQEVIDLIRGGGVSEIIEFGNGGLVLLGGRVGNDAPLVNHKLSELREQYGNGEWILAAVVRGSETMVVRGERTPILPGDHALIMTLKGSEQTALDLMGLEVHQIRRVLVAGSNRLSSLTAHMLVEDGFDVVIIEDEVDRCRRMSEEHPKALVIQGDPTDPEVLEDLDIDEKDAIVAMSGRDERNILACLLAKAMGASEAIMAVNRQSYVHILDKIEVDAMVSSRQAAANAILQFVRRGRVHSVVTFSDSDAEVIELEVIPRSDAVGMRLDELGLLGGAIIGGINRGSRCLVPTGATEIEPRDRLIVFALPEAIRAVEELFSE
ncbi:MAG: Trk system potassium transporter TrkA [Acidimicrobiia bacterium]|nr:Trk system potassium transporter TrkA [Acidimicrobiia bacterium]MBT8249660.1 Trk system potassium transporter TrkA [Acidimicrobiia bacterium]NNC43972.1 Trk system potassium transporter TrkA [Acidimicrobiia bacterium]NND14464.1 Trk system potassium transporter TrkA [Acidimicrobiia bacterium]NNL27833.1 Trk system potassium transporter TrkA [Acidimicrobiia bacterium]